MFLCFSISLGTMATKDAFYELGCLVSNFYFVANEVDQKIDYLIHIKATEQHEEILEALGQEINDLRQSQELLKKDFAETMMKLCATEGFRVRGFGVYSLYNGLLSTILQSPS